MRDLVQNTFSVKENEGENKVMPLSQAIQKVVRPGMSLLFSGGSSTSVLELCRQFWGTKPDFTLICILIGNFLIIPVYGRLVKYGITSSMSHFYPTPAPVTIIQQAEREGTFKAELWSMVTLQTRFMAGALGLPFIPTKALIGTDLARDLPDGFKIMDDPFGAGSQGVIKPLNPDVAFVHGLVADSYGNAILGVGGGVDWGARASKKVILTVEKIVSTDFIRRHNYLVQLPGYLVESVSETPLGGHPGGQAAFGLPEVEGYEQDYEFTGQFRAVVEDPQKIDPWIKEWVLDSKGHEDYLARLGKDKVAFLKAQAKRTWQEKFAIDKVSTSPDYTPGEMYVLNAARQLKKRMKEEGYRTVLMGAGPATLAAAVAYYLCQKEGYQIDLMNPGGNLGMAPRPGRPQMGDIVHVPTSRMRCDSTVVTWSWVAGGGNSRCVFISGGAQVDKEGNTNVTRVGNLRLFGGGGLMDGYVAKEVVIMISRHQPSRLPERVDFISAAGGPVSSLVTPLGVFEKRDGELVLAGYIAGKSKAEMIKEIKEGCGWDLKIAADIVELPPPTLDELLTIRSIDPEGQWTRL